MLAYTICQPCKNQKLSGMRQLANFWLIFLRENEIMSARTGNNAARTLKIRREISNSPLKQFANQLGHRSSTY